MATSCGRPAMMGKRRRRALIAPSSTRRMASEQDEISVVLRTLAFTELSHSGCMCSAVKPTRLSDHTPLGRRCGNRSKEARMLAEKFFLVLETLLSHTNPDGGPRVESTSRQVPIKLHAEAASSRRADGFHLAVFSGWTVRRMPTSVEPSKTSRT